MAVFYLPPAGFDGDFAQSAKADDLRTNWDVFIGGSIADRDDGALFYDAKNDPAPGISADRVPIPWNGFPRSLSMFFNADTSPAGAQQALRVAEILRPITAIIIPTAGRFHAIRVVAARTFHAARGEGGRHTR